MLELRALAEEHGLSVLRPALPEISRSIPGTFFGLYEESHMG